MNAKHKRILKLALDAVMLILLVLMYKDQVIGIGFHEIGGLALIGLTIIHLLVNAKWIGAVTRRLFLKATSTHARLCYIVDALLLVAFLTVGITGVLISKFLFSVQPSGNFKTLHYFASAVAVVLIGVHLGLHADCTLGKLFRKNAKNLRSAALGVVLVAILAFGAYSLFTTSFVSYLTAPIRAATPSHIVPSATGETALDGRDDRQHPMDLSELPDADSHPADESQSTDNEAFSGERRFDGEFDKGNSYTSGFADVLLLIAQYGSIIALFAAITYPFTRLSKWRTSGLHSDPPCGDGSLLDEPEVSSERADEVDKQKTKTPE